MSHERIVHHVVRKGSRGSAVKKLQRALNHHLSRHTTVDGAFGRQTKNRVKRFQRNHSMKQDGIVGRGTWRALGYKLVLPKGGRVLLAPGVRPAGPRLMRAIRAVAKETGTDLLIKSGDRTPYEAWSLRMRYLRGAGALAALCCWRTGYHSWGACGKTPRSAHASGRAIDVGTLKRGVYRSIGYDSRVMRSVHRHGMWLSVRTSSGRIIEQWHLSMK